MVLLYSLCIFLIKLMLYGLWNEEFHHFYSNQVYIVYKNLLLKTGIKNQKNLAIKNSSRGESR